MGKEHRYEIAVRWTGNLGKGTSAYREYSRNHEISAEAKAPIAGSSDPAFRGDPARYSPEDLFVASISSCHMLWMLHLCADRGIVVTAYEDGAEGVMREAENGSGAFTHVVLRPRIGLGDVTRIEEARALHQRAHELCFIANSVRCEIRVEPEFEESRLPGVKGS